MHAYMYLCTCVCVCDLWLCQVCFSVGQYTSTFRYVGIVSPGVRVAWGSSYSWCNCNLIKYCVIQSNVLNLWYHIQGRSKVFTTGQAKVNTLHYVIKCIGSRYVLQCSHGFCFFLCVDLSLSNLQITLAFCLVLNCCTVESYLVQHKIFCMPGWPILFSISSYAISM